jgi:retron-type reverse transcriptase
VERHLLAGRQWVVDLDIEKCYDSIPHEPLVDRVARRISDGKVLDLIRSFLKSGVMEEMKVSYDTTGTPQGGIISPVLANIYLHDLDVAMETHRIAWGAVCRRCGGVVPKPGRSGTGAGNKSVRYWKSWD